MFEIRKNKSGKVCIVTNRAFLAVSIADECEGRFPVWFTGGPTKETALALSISMCEEFGAATSYRKSASTDKDSKFHAYFT